MGKMEQHMAKISACTVAVCGIFIILQLQIATLLAVLLSFVMTCPPHTCPTEAAGGTGTKPDGCGHPLHCPAQRALLYIYKRANLDKRRGHAFIYIRARLSLR